MYSKEYQDKAMRTNNKTDIKEMLLNASLGLCGESGEFADHIKKYAFHGHEIDIDYTKKELGDIMWYIALASHSLGLELGDIMETNINKLIKRYPQGFSNEDSLNRKD